VSTAGLSVASLRVVRRGGGALVSSWDWWVPLPGAGWCQNGAAGAGGDIGGAAVANWAWPSRSSPPMKQLDVLRNRCEEQTFRLLSLPAPLGRVKLVYIDAPFNTQQSFSTTTTTTVCRADRAHGGGGGVIRVRQAVSGVLRSR